MKSTRNTCFWVLLCDLILQSTSLSASSIAEPALAENHLVANGRQETLLTIPVFGRYSISTSSGQGTALRYINKMSGPSPISGSPGESDGRIDAFLDFGEYKIVTLADANGSGNVNLSVKPFIAVDEQTVPELVENKLVSAQLNDLEKRSYWINLKKRRTVLLEAAGRSLGDLRLWHEGNWLLDAKPSSQTIEPTIGKPLTVRRLSVELNPGFYLLVAYGGQPLPWAQTSSEQPFHLRMGIPQIAANGVDRKITSPFGYDRWLVPASTDYYRLELEQSSAASIAVARFEQNYNFANSGRRQFIDKKSRLPVAEVFSRKGNKSRREIVTITATAGQPYIFQRFSAVQKKVIKDPGTYWVSSLHSGYGEDSVDATSVLTDSYKREKYVDSRAITLTNSRGWQRQFNVLDSLTLYFEVKQQGNYRVEADGIEGRYRFEPFTTFRSNNYKTPRARYLGDEWPLDRGFYILTIIPNGDARGVARVSVFPGGRKPSSASPAQIASRYKSVKVKSKHRYTLYLNQQPGVTSGILVRRYPIDLSESMPLTLNPGEKLKLRVKIPSQGELVAQSQDGSLEALKLKKSTSSRFITAVSDGNRYAVDSGRYDLALHNQSDQSQHLQLQFTAAERLQSTPLPAFNLNLVRRPGFPELNAGQPRYLDLKKRQWAAFNVVVQEPGLYKLESTGLLETQGNIRTRVITRLDQKAANGVGRNFLIQQYLREGEYQLALAPQGETQGHLGVQLSKTALINGGEIEDGVIARHSLPSAKGLKYEFEVEKAGRYQLKGFGINGYFNARLEDGDGWPLLKPGTRADFDLDLHAGNYRLVVLPTALPTRVVTELKRIEKAPAREGHGPFAMDLNQSLFRHIWLEPAEAESRQPDSWVFELPAPSEITLSLSQGMQAALIALKANSVPILFNSAKPLKQTLAAGRYRIEASASRRNNRLEYSLGFSSSVQLVGMQKNVTAPLDIELSIGHDSLIELSSFGQQDVKAQLFDADDKLVAVNDDRANDWNFNIIESLAAGRYRLHVSPVGKSSAETSIRLSEPETGSTTQLALPAEFKINSPQIHSYTLDLSAKSGVFAVAAKSRDSISLTLEKSGDNNSWKTIARAGGENALLLASIENTPEQGKNYRLKIWSPEQRGAEIRVSAGLLETQLSAEASITQGLDLTSETLLSSKLVAASIALNSPGMFKVKQQLAKSILWVGDKNQQLQAYDGFISAAEKIWLVSLKPGESIQADRLLLEDKILQFNINTANPVWVDMESTDNRYDLIVAESRAGLPGVATMQGNQFDARGTGVGLNSTITLVNSQAENGSSGIRLWDSGSSDTALPVRLKRYRFDQPNRQKLMAGATDVELPSQAALSFQLDGSLQDIQFNLPAGVAAVLLKKGEVLRSFWSARQGRNYQVWSHADSLLVFNIRTDVRVLNIQLAAANTAAVISKAGIFKHFFTHAGNFSLAINSADASKDFVEVYGDQTELLIQNRKGQVYRGQQVALSDDAVLNVSHGVGLVSVWLNSSDKYISTSDEKPAPLPARTRLTGPAETIELARDKAGFVNMQSASPLIVTIQRNGLSDQVKVFETGLKTTLFLPPGKSRLKFESTSPQAMEAVLYLAEVSPVALQEGLGSRVSLLPGDARVYRFTLTKQQQIGIGVQSSIDLTQASLFDQTGRLLGNGVAQKHSLSAGSYFLLLELPPDIEAGVELRPAIVGIESRDTNASKEIMHEYQKYSTPEAL